MTSLYRFGRRAFDASNRKIVPWSFGVPPSLCQKGICLLKNSELWYKYFSECFMTRTTSATADVYVWSKVCTHFDFLFRDPGGGTWMINAWSRTFTTNQALVTTHIVWWWLDMSFGWIQSVCKSESIVSTRCDVINRYKPFWKSASSDIKSGRVHLDVWRIDEQSFLQSTG